MPTIINKNKLYKCFVCDTEIKDSHIQYHEQVKLPVCAGCIGSDDEQQKAKDLLEGLAEDFVCGCI